MIRTLLISLFVFIWSTSLSAQAQSEPEKGGRYYWLSLSGGAGKGATSAVALNAEIKNFTLGLEYRESYFGELFDFFGPPNASARCLNATGGKLFKGDWWLIHLSGGIGYARQRIPYKVGETGGWFSTGIYEYEEANTVGMVASAEIAVELNVYKLGLTGGVAMAGGNYVLFAGLNLGFGKFF